MPPPPLLGFFFFLEQSFEQKYGTNYPSGWGPEKKIFYMETLIPLKNNAQKRKEPIWI